MADLISTPPVIDAAAEKPVSPTVIRVFPESGHHFQFVPFTRQQLEKYKVLEKLCREGKTPWRTGTTTDDRQLFWLRYRFCSFSNDTTQERQYGVLIAVETNLGRIARGWIYRPEEPVEQNVSTAELNARQDPSPYAFADQADLPLDGIQQITLRTNEPALELPDETGMPEVPLTILWQKPLAELMDVDLIIDFGNTRTVALLLENNVSANGMLNSICYPVRFVPRGSEFTPFAGKDDPAAIVDSWFVLQEPLFANLEHDDKDPDGTPANVVKELRWNSIKLGIWPFAKWVQNVSGNILRTPQMFVEYSPAILGAEASNILYQLPLELGGNFSLSSPKRYLWDQDILGHLGATGLPYWTMNLNRWNPDFDAYEQRHKVHELNGTLLRFLDEDGRDWSLDSGPPPNERPEIASRPSSCPKAPAYPRADTLTWTALGIIEMAYRQMMSAAWRELLGTAYVPRRLRNILVTFPPGWTGQELNAYRQKWQKAIDIFAISHLPDSRSLAKGGHRPALSMEIDEAVASQLPIIFGEIQRLGTEGENWIELVGRGKGAEARVRVLNIDIGGGTTDISIIEYRDELVGPGIKLKAELYYRDSSTIAGDAMVRRIIESVLLPRIGDCLEGPALREIFQRLLGRQKQAQRTIWNRITRLVLIPMVRWWLKTLASRSAATSNAAPQEMIGSDGPTVDSACLDGFNKLCQNEGLPGNLLPYNAPFHYDREGLYRCVRENFSEIFRAMAKVVESFDCDLVLVSGKPSELPPVRQLLEDLLPVLPQRIMFAQNAEVGDWYPLSAEGRVHDAKTVTVAGAALFQAIKSGLVPGWTIEQFVSPRLLQRNYWGVMPTGTKRDFGRLILNASDDRKTIEMMVPTRIGRRMLPADVRPESVYELRWRDARRKENAILKVEFERVLPKDLNHPEFLKLVSAEGKADNGTTVSLDDLELRLCTLDAEDYWMDSGTFDVIWNEINSKNGHC